MLTCLNDPSKYFINPTRLYHINIFLKLFPLILAKIKLLGRNGLTKVVVNKDEQIKVNGLSSNLLAHSDLLNLWVSFIWVTPVVNYKGQIQSSRNGG